MSSRFRLNKIYRREGIGLYMTVRFCDRCGREIKSKGMIFERFLGSSKIVSYFHIEHQGPIREGQYDLCHSCAVEFSRFMYGGSNSEWRLAKDE